MFLARIMRSLDVAYVRLVASDQRAVVPLDEHHTVSLRSPRRAILPIAVAAVAVIALTAGYIAAGRPYTGLPSSAKGPEKHLTWPTNGYEIEANPVAAGGMVYAYGVGHQINNNVLDQLYDAKIFAFNKDTGRRRWIFSLIDPGDTNAIYAFRNTVYVAGVARVYALNGDNGNIRWVYRTKADVLAEPVARDGQLYMGDTSGFIYSIRADDGVVKWKRKLRSVSEIDELTVGDGILYVVDGYDNKLFALDPADGRIVWGVTNLRPNSVAASGDVVYVNSSDRLFALNPANGRTEWKSPFEPDLGTELVVSPNVVLVGGLNGTLYASSTLTGRLDWTYHVPKDQYGHESPIASVAVSDGTAYMFTFNNTIYAFNAISGSLRWGYFLGDEAVVTDIDALPLTVVGDVVYIGQQSDVSVIQG